MRSKKVGEDLLLIMCGRVLGVGFGVGEFVGGFFLKKACCRCRNVGLDVEFMKVSF